MPAKGSPYMCEMQGLDVNRSDTNKVTTPPACVNGRDAAEFLEFENQQAGALFMARMGLHVFPVEPGGKVPLLPDWYGANCSNDPERIRAWAAEFPNCNWGIACAKSGLAVFDCDVKSGQDGNSAYSRFIEDQLFDRDAAPSLTVKTPSGGTHVYFALKDRKKPYLSCKSFLPGVEIKCEKTQVVCPGSIVNGVQYKIIRSPYAINRMPREVEDCVASYYRERERKKVVNELGNTRVNATSVLTDSEIEEILKRVAARDSKSRSLVAGDWRDADFSSQSEADLWLCTRVAEAGASAEMIDAAMRASGLMRPKWERSDYRSGTIAQALKLARPNPASVFEARPEEGEVVDSPGPAIAGLSLQDCRAGRFLHGEPAPLDWVLKDSLLSGCFGLLAGPPGAGKSLLSMQLAVSVVLGDPRFVGDAWNPDRPGAAVILAAEEIAAVAERRLRAIVQTFPGAEFEPDPAMLHALDQNLYVVPLAGKDMRLFKADNGNLTATERFNEIKTALCSIDDLRLVVIDTLARTYGKNENDNSAATFYASLAEEIAIETQSAVIVVHHLNKSAGGFGDKFDLEAWLDQGALRGASALTGAARWVCNLVAVPEKYAAKKLNADRDVHLVAAKVSKKNYGHPEDVQYFRRGPGGVLLRHDVAPSPDEVERQAALLARIKETVAALETPMTPKAFARSHAALWKSEGQRISRAAIEELIEVGLLQGIFEIRPGELKNGRSADFLAVATCE